MRIDRKGVTIQGTLVDINCGGLPGIGKGAAEVEPERVKEAAVQEPPRPEMDDVSVKGLGQ